jgi:hypothetical protein
MATFTKFNPFVEAVAEKVHNLGSDALKVMLTNTAPVAANAVKADLTEITAGNGYTAGGNAVTITTSSQTAGLYSLIGNDVTFGPMSGSVGPLRYAVLYNSTPAAGNLIGFWDYGSAITLGSGDSLIVDFDQVNGILTLQ